jgi:hypothetical protein
VNGYACLLKLDYIASKVLSMGGDVVSTWYWWFTCMCIKKNHLKWSSTICLPFHTKQKKKKALGELAATSVHGVHFPLPFVPLRSGGSFLFYRLILETEWNLRKWQHFQGFLLC